VLTSDDVYDAFYDDEVTRGFLHSHSYTGNPLACAAAIAVLDIFRDEDVVARNKDRAREWAAALAPGPIRLVYFFAVQFLNKGIDSWFNVEIRKSLDDALVLSRSALEVRMREHMADLSSLAMMYRKGTISAAEYHAEQARMGAGPGVKAGPSGMGGALGGIGTKVAAAAGVAYGAKQVLDLADAYTGLENRLRQVTNGEGELAGREFPVLPCRAGGQGIRLAFDAEIVERAAQRASPAARTGRSNVALSPPATVTVILVVLPAVSMSPISNTIT